MPASPTSRMGLAAPAGADLASTIDNTLQAMATAIDNQSTIFSQGTFASRPTSTGGSPGKTGRFYYATDIHVLFWDFGTGWVAIDPQAYETILTGNARLRDTAGGLVAGTYFFAGGEAVASGGDATGGPAGVQLLRFDDADYLGEGRTQKLRLRAQVLCNGIAPAVNLAFGLYPVTPGGGADVLALTLGTVVAGSTVAINAPTANQVNPGSSGDFTIPADGTYVVGMTSSGSAAADSRELVAYQVDSRLI